MRKWLAVAVLSSNLALHNLQRFAPVTLYDEFRQLWDTDYTGAGWLFAAYLIAYALMLFPMGLLADRIDNKKLMMAGVGLNLVGTLAFVMAPGLALAMLARVLLGMSGAFLYVPTVRYVVTTFDQASRGKAMGWVQAGAGVGQVIGLCLVPLLTGWAGLQGAFLMPALVALALLAGQWTQLASTVSSGKKAEAVGSVFAIEGFKPFLGFVFLAFMSSYAIAGWLPTYLRSDFGFSAAEAGLAASLSALALSLCSPLAGTLSDRLGARKPVLLAGSAVSVVCFAIMAFAHDVRIIIVAAFLKGAGSAMTTPVSQMLAGEAFAAAGAGVAVGIASTVSQAASAASGPFFGFTLDATGSFAMLWGVALGCVVLSMLCLTMVRERAWEK